MPQIIRRTVRKRGTALIVALQLTALTLLSLASFVGGPQQQSPKAPADTQVRAPATNGADAGIQANQNQTSTAQPLTAADKTYLRQSAVYANKVSGPRATQVFNLATSRAAAAAKARNAQGPESPNAPTLTTDQEDYPPYSYVYMHGTGFQPGETVDMIVIETDPNQESFEPWQVVADENGEIYTS